MKSGETLQTPLGRVRGLGSAKEGVNHWWHQRLTAVALVPLALWLVVALIGHLGGDYVSAARFVGSGGTAILFVLALGAGFYHAALGAQVVIEDYVHTEWLKIAALVLLRLGCFLFAVAGMFAVMRVTFRM
jgi:succinate dehydrogenase / fumarate reductase membrane anchor subunit